MPGEGSESRKQKSGHTLAGEPLQAQPFPHEACYLGSPGSGDNQLDHYSDEKDWESLPYSLPLPGVTERTTDNDQKLPDFL